MDIQDHPKYQLALNVPIENLGLSSETLEILA